MRVVIVSTVVTPSPTRAGVAPLWWLGLALSTIYVVFAIEILSTSCTFYIWVFYKNLFIVAPMWLGLALSRFYVVFAIGILNMSCTFYIWVFYKNLFIVAPLWLGLALSRFYVVFAIGILNTSCTFYIWVFYKNLLIVAPLWLGLALSRMYVVFAIGILNTSCNFYLRLLYLGRFSRQWPFFLLTKIQSSGGKIFFSYLIFQTRDLCNYEPDSLLLRTCRKNCS